MLLCVDRALFNPLTLSQGPDRWTEAAVGRYRWGVRERNGPRSIGLEDHQGLLIVADSEASSALIVSLLACGKDNSHGQGLMNLTSVLLRKHRELIAFDYRGDCVCMCVGVCVCGSVSYRWGTCKNVCVMCLCKIESEVYKLTDTFIERPRIHLF